MTEPREFDCIDCDAHVWRAVALATNDQDVCATCEFLRTIEDPVERDKLRALLNKGEK